jgi:ribosomal protein S18 acetylase RimI-like enzyme
VSIVPVTTADRASTFALWEKAGLTRPWNDPYADFDLALANATSTILLARDGAQLVGSLMVGFDGHRGWVYYLASAPQSHGQGIGRMLMLAAEEWLKQRRSPKIQLMVRHDNEAARGFYAAIGYEVQDVVTIGRRLDTQG